MGSNDSELLQTILQELREDVRDSGHKLAGICVDMQNLKATVEELSQVVHKGNGHSLLTRVALLEENRNTSAEDNKDKKVTTLARLGAWGAIVPGVLALIASILALVYH